MKKGWEYKELGEVCDFRSGFAFKSNKFTEVGEPIIRISDIQNEEIGDSNLVFFDPKSYKEDLSKYLIYPDDILIAMSGGTTGKLGINNSKKTYYLNQRVGVFRENKKYLNHRYLFHYLHTKSEESLRIAAGAAQPNLSTTQIKSFEIPVPPLTEQQTIVSYLDAAFAKIDAMKANAEKALGEAKALFQASLKDLLTPKEGWKEKKFGNICKFVRGPFGGSLKKECFKDSGYAVYEQQNAIYNKFTFRYYIDEEKYKSLIRFKVNSGDLIMSCSGTIGKVAIIPEHSQEGIINQALLKLTPNKEIEAHFLKYLMESNYFKEVINANIEGVAIKNIVSVAVLKEINLYIPKVTEQQSIVATLDTLKSKVDRLQANFEKIVAECGALKQAILREVFE